MTDLYSFSHWLSFGFEFSRANNSQWETRQTDADLWRTKSRVRNFWREKQALVCPGFFPDNLIPNLCLPTLNDKRGSEERAWERGRFPDKLRKCCNCKSQYILVCRCLADSPYTDVCFLVHGVPMPAHRVILTGRSSYFAHMFMSKWRDRPLIELKHKLVRPSETLIVLEHLISVVTSLFESLFLFTYFTVTWWRPVYMSGMGYCMK